jgi:hypothetical protein
VEHHGRVNSVWSNHTDVRPTVLAALGLRDRYVHDGRVLTEILESIEGVAFDRRPLDENLAERLIAQSNALLKRADAFELEE